jgi:hypothetical protein
MPFVLTSAARLACVHGGQVTVPPLPGPVSIDGATVLCMGDIVGAPIVGCTQLAPGTKPCTTVGAPLPGSCSPTVSVAGRPVYLDTFTASTDGSPPGMVSVLFPGQGKVQA